MMSRNPAAGGVCGRESELYTTGGSMIVLTDTRLMLVVFNFIQRPKGYHPHHHHHYLIPSHSQSTHLRSA